ncbi:unnamed protein product, partial [Didymodactylos carnosus]
AASTTDKTTHNIVASGVAQSSTQAISSLLDLRNLKRTVRRTRQRQQNPLAIPTTRDTIIIDPEHTKTMRQHTFLQFDSSPINKRLLIFSTKKQLRILESSESEYVDGTFSVVPEIYFQLYTINATYLEHIVPVVYILLQGKTQRLYKQMIDEIVQLSPKFSPQNIMMDYERAAINVFSKKFPTAHISGCFLQNIYRRVQHAGLTKLYADDPDFSQNIRSIAPLSFLPTTDIISTFQQLKQQFPAQGQPVINYFEETYVGIESRLFRLRKQPKFELDLWNTHENTIQYQQ